MSQEHHGSRRVGQVKEVTSLSNPIVKDIKALANKKDRDETRSFMAEGLKLVIDALELGFEIKTLVYAKNVKDKPQVVQVATKTVARGGLVLEVSEKVLSSITRRDNPQMVVGIFTQRLTSLRDIRPKAGETYVALDRVRDPGNLGTMLRTGDAVGAGGLILLDESTDPYAVEAVRASMGAIFTQKLVQTRWEEFLPWLRGGPGQLVATWLGDDTQDYQAVRYAAPTFILTGNESQGMPAEYAAAADVRVKMPMMGKADSLNAAIATAVMAYEVLNQRRS